jgi:hypothetical protein
MANRNDAAARRAAAIAKDVANLVFVPLPNDAGLRPEQMQARVLAYIEHQEAIVSRYCLHSGEWMEPKADPAMVLRVVHEILLREVEVRLAELGWRLE